MLLIVGTYSEKLGHVSGKGSGLYVLDVDDETLKVKQSSSPASVAVFGKPQLGPSSLHGMRNPTYLIAHQSTKSSSAPNEVHVYVVDEREDCPGSLVALKLNTTTGELSHLGDPKGIVADDRPNEGGACCHVMVTPDEEYVIAANYICGSIVAVGRNKVDGSLNNHDVHYYRLPPKGAKREADGVEIRYPGPNAKRQDRAHAHMVMYSRGTKSASILVPDLGSDIVWSIPYIGRDGESRNTSCAGPLGTPVATGYDPVLAGGGPRHMVLHPNPNIRKCYVAYELTSLVACFDLDEETGAIETGGDPPGIRNTLSGPRCNAFLSSGGDEPSEKDARKYEHLFRHDERGSVRLCSDANTSVAAVRIVPDGSHVLVSSRIVDDEGAVSAIPLTPGGNIAPWTSVRVRGTVGRTVRDFVILNGSSGDDAVVVLAANQDTDEIVILREDEEAEIMTKDAPTPVCLCIVPK